jgi:hypothetical protein
MPSPDLRKSEYTVADAGVIGPRAILTQDRSMSKAQDAVATAVALRPEGG